MAVGIQLLVWETRGIFHTPSNKRQTPQPTAVKPRRWTALDEYYLAGSGDRRNSTSGLGYKGIILTPSNKSCTRQSRSVKRRQLTVFDKHYNLTGCGDRRNSTSYLGSRGIFHTLSNKSQTPQPTAVKLRLLTPLVEAHCTRPYQTVAPTTRKARSPIVVRRVLSTANRCDAAELKLTRSTDANVKSVK
jgi:hypothetical protein